MRKRLAFLSLLAIVPSRAFGVVWYVDADATGAGDGTSWGDAYTSIQPAITAASSNDSIWVAEATYAEAITLKSGVSVYGGFEGTETQLSERDIVAYPSVIDASTADGGGPADHVVLMSGITNARIDGFTITGGFGRLVEYGGGGLLCNNLDDTSTIADCIITGNSTDESGSGAGVRCRYSSPILTNCTISGNWCGGDTPGVGGGLDCYYSSPRLSYCTISDNRGGFNGGGVSCSHGSPWLINCTISGNSATFGGGMEWYGSSPVLIGCVISGNSADGGGGVFCGASTATIIKCIISGNSATGGGGGVFGQDSAPTIKNCIISGNSATGGGGQYWEDAGGVLLRRCSSASLINCTISSNSTTGQGGGLCCQADGGGPCTPTITNTIFENNTPDAIYERNDIGGGADPSVTFCLFYDNTDYDYYDDDTGAVYTGAANINANIPQASDNVDGHPFWQMNGFVSSITGTWTGPPSYDVDAARTTLTDTSASLVPGALVGMLINANTGQRKHALITANTSMTVEVVGDLTVYVSSGDQYRIVDYHLTYGSAAIDAGTLGGAPSTDFEGESRPFNLDCDIGADEFVDTDNDHLSDWFEMAYDGDFLHYDPYPTGADLNASDSDTDGDGVPDDEELLGGSDPTDSGSTPDSSVVWVDFTWHGLEGGGVFYPYNTLAEGTSAVDVAGTVKIRSGETEENPRITKAMRLEAPDGPVRIGVSTPLGLLVRTALQISTSN